MKRSRFTDEQIVRILTEADQHLVTEARAFRCTIYACGSVMGRWIIRMKSLKTEIVV